MNDQRETLEVNAPTVDEAIKKGLQELGVERSAVDIEVLDEGSQGLFGLGSRDSKILISVADLSDDRQIVAESTPEPSPAEETVEWEKPEVVDDTLAIVKQIVEELLSKMGVAADVVAVYDEDDSEVRTVNIDVNGKDLSILIGRNGETLNAFQFITKLIAGKELGRAVPLKIDVEGYRARREKQLRNLAQKMAEQVINTGQSLALEPMTPAERRIVHIELRNNQDVYTESLGDGNRRKVVIYPNK